MPDFPYINARVRAMHSRMLRPDQVDELLGTSSLAAYLQALSLTPYGGELQESLSRFEGVRAVDDALARDLQRASRAILGYADGLPRRLIEVVLMRWDLVNLNAIVGGKHMARPPEEISAALLPAGLLGRTVLEEMAAAPDAKRVVGVLAAVDHPLAGRVAEGFLEYTASHDALALQARITRAYAGLVIERTRGRNRSARLLRGLLQAELDSGNAKTALRLARMPEVDTSVRRRMYVPGGELLDEELFITLSFPATQAQAWRELRSGGFPVRDLPEDLVRFERELDLRLARLHAAEYRGDPLGIGIVLGYLAKKSAEVVNLRLIARGRLLGMPREMLAAEMMRV